MDLRFQAYNPGTRKFDQTPGSVPRSKSKKPSNNKPRYNTQALAIGVVRDDGKSLLHPGSPSTPEANGDDQAKPSIAWLSLETARRNLVVREMVKRYANTSTKLPVDPLVIR
ncbi:hypothetical protein C8A00DRAFT_39167, partial [Chaetomidium leptoderma]